MPPPDPTRADMVAPHEITAVGIEMLINEEVEIGQIQRLNKANAANLRLEDDFASEAKPHAEAAAPRAKPSRRPRRRPPSRRPSARPDAASHRPCSAAAAAPRRDTAGDGAETDADPPRRRRPSALRRSTRFSAAPACEPQRLDDKQAEQVLHRLGQLMREVVLGVNENLHVRAEQKNVLRVPTTTIQPQNNNPLKFAASVEEALNNLLFRDSAEYLSAVDAVRETFGDIKQHQQHMLAAVRTAVVDYIGRLDPEELESKISSGSAACSMNAANKLKYWDLFKDLYQVVSQHQPGQFPHQFIEELARAYELEESRAASPAPRRGKPSTASVAPLSTPSSSIA